VKICTSSLSNFYPLTLAVSGRRSIVAVLRLEIPSGMCAKLRTVAASNNRAHMPWSLYYCLFAPRIYIVVLRAHPLRGESHIQHNANGEVATAATIMSGAHFWMLEH